MSFMNHSNDRRPSFIIHAFLYLSRSLDGTFKGEGCGVSPPHGEGVECLRGVGPARRGPFVSAKGPKTIGARAWPFWCLCPSPERLGLRNSLRSDSPRPPNRFRDRGAAPPAGAMRWRQKLARSFFPRPLGEGRVRAILAASSSRIRCRPYYNDGEAQPRPQAPGHGAGYEDQLQRHWIPDNTGSPIRSSITNVEDRRRGQASGIVHVHSFVDRMKG